MLLIIAKALFAHVRLNLYAFSIPLFPSLLSTEIRTFMYCLKDGMLTVGTYKVEERKGKKKLEFSRKLNKLYEHTKLKKEKAKRTWNF